MSRIKTDCIFNTPTAYSYNINMKHKRGYYDVFVRTCAKYPSNIAVRHYDNGVYKCYTYSELFGACEYLSQYLAQMLLCKQGVIGLISDRNILIPCAIAAAHKYCTTFMFLDPTLEIDNICKNIKFNIFMTIQKQNGSVNMKSPTNNLKPDKTLEIFDFSIKFYIIIPGDNSFHARHLNEHSYIAMTSGSTGDPKHIQVPIECLQPNIDDLTKSFNINVKDVIYFSTPLTFDPSMVEILLACQNAASLLIAPERMNILFPENKQNSVTFWQTTPSKFFQKSDAEIRNKILSANSTLKILALGGEPLNSLSRLRELKDKDNGTRIFTLYGVTEMSCWACVAELDLNNYTNDWEVPLGNCLSETQVVVEPTDQENKNIGKIVLLSKTRKCLVLSNPHNKMEENSLKFIDTGDVAEVKNGTIYYMGRTDDVVKRFGHKVNLQIIEAAVMQCTKVKTCSCLWLPKPMLLIVYFSSESLKSQELSDFLKCKLDDKHWPDKVIRVDNLPTNSHGKVSKHMISKLFETNELKSTKEDSLKDLFLKELNLILTKKFTYEEIKDKNFFAIGGTSFLAVSMCNKLALLSPVFGQVLLPHLMSQQNTIGEIFSVAEKEAGTEQKKPRKRLRSSVGSLMSNSISHKKLNSKPSDLANFAVEWSLDTGKCVDASPTLFQNGSNLNVTVGSHSGKIVVVDAITGKLQGKISIKSRIEAPILCTHHPTKVPCGVVGTYDGTIVCFSLQNCARIWKTKIGSMIKSKAMCCNGHLYVASYDGILRCFDMTTGSLIHEINVTNQPISADLVLAKQEYIILGTLSGVCASIHTVSNTVAWRGTLSSPVFASPVLYDEDKYVVFAEVSGEIHCRTVEKGIKIWKYQGVKGNIFSSLYIKQLDNLKWQIIFGCHDNHVYSINIKNFQPSLRWKTKLQSPIYATPCGLSEKLVLSASNNGILCVMDSDNGVIVAEYNLPDETFSSPAILDDKIYIGCRNDHLYCLKFVSNL